MCFNCSILRSIEFPSMGPGGASGESSSKSLEMILLERTKALQQAESAALKAAVSAGADLQGKFAIRVYGSHLS